MPRPDSTHRSPFRQAFHSPVTWVVLLVSGLVGWSVYTNSGSAGTVAETPTAVASPATASPSVVSQPRPTVGFTSTTRPDPDQSWRIGACINDSGVLVSLVSCALPHDGVIVDTAALAAGCSDATTHTVKLTVGVACLMIGDPPQLEGFDEDSCTFDGIPLEGSVFLIDSPFGYDMVVSVTDSSFLADLTVAPVENAWEADDCGKWYLVEFEWQADFVIAVTDTTYLADFSITLTDSPFLAGT